MPGRSVIITSAVRGVGEACARRFARNGDRLILADQDEEAGQALLDDLRAGGAEAAFVHADVSNRLDVHNIIAEALDAYGGVDVLAHAMMAQLSAPFLQTSEDDFERIVAANLRGAFLINQAAAKHFVKRSEQADGGAAPGAIVNIGSVEAVTPAADHAAFAASQGGVQQLTKAVALAMSPYNVRVNMVGVGAVKGELAEGVARDHERAAIPLKRIGDPEEAAEVVFFLAGEAASYVTGQCVYVDGGRLALSGAASREAD